MTTTLYDTDFDAWAQQQAAALRARAWNQLDIEHLAEEVEELRKTERNALRSQLRRLTSHLLKWHYQPEKRELASDHPRRSRSPRRWYEMSPSLKDSSTPSWLGHTRVPTPGGKRNRAAPGDVSGDVSLERGTTPKRGLLARHLCHRRSISACGRGPRETRRSARNSGRPE